MKKVFAILSVCAVLPLTAHAELTELWARGVTEKSGWVDFNKSYSNTRDNNLCWAAAASNIIDWWQKQYEIKDSIPQGNAIWDKFKNSFSDNGGDPSKAFQWWLDGTYNTGGSSGYAELEASASAMYYMKPWEYNGPRAKDYIQRFGGDYQTLSQSIISSLKSGCGITLSLSSVHEVTLWGVEYDSISNKITKLWLTDSDDEQQNQNLDGLFSVDCYEYKYSGSETETYLGIKGYWKQPENLYVHIATVLKPADDFLTRISVPIPEPSAFGLLAGIAAIALAGTRRSRRRKYFSPEAFSLGERT